MGKNRAETLKAYRVKNRDRIKTVKRVAELRREYGVTLEQYNEMLKKQGGVCRICKQGETALDQLGNVRTLSVDHCHSTGVIRGLLCLRCNRVLGMVEDQPWLLKMMAMYVEFATVSVSRVDVDKLLEDLK